jgi:hypothetical protein
MRRPVLLAALSALALIGLAGQSAYEPWHSPDGSGIVGTVIYCTTGNTREAAPCGSLLAPMNVMSAPFTRLHSAPIQLSGLGPTPKNFAINRPANATTYRIVNPCDVDIRLLGVMNATDQVTTSTGVLYLARTEATMGTSRPVYISAMTIGTPTGDCTPEMHYGIGGG